ncbi:hypothetical protein H0H93_015834 [Arthromyces matolae]|nr:hypothetical protein H0H93_015834 [Arthromyces matolae]
MHSRKSFSSEESPVIKKTLQLLFTNAKGTRITEIEASMESCGVKEGTLFFYSVFADVLTWERTLYSQDKYCPLSCELQRLNQMIIYVTLIRGKLTDMEFADAIFRGGGSKRARFERHIRDMWDVRLNAAAICKYIRTQRSLLLQGKGLPPQDAHDGGTDSKTHEG